jgi:hypothetical protein
VDDQRAAVGIKQGVWSLRQCYPSAGVRQTTPTILPDREIQQIACMGAGSVLQAMLLVLGVKMTASGLKFGGIALPYGMDMDTVVAWRQVVHLDGDLHTAAALNKGRASNSLALSIM